MEYTEITKEAFKSIVENEQESFDYNQKFELAEKTFFKAKGMQLLTIFNFISNVKQYYLLDINY
tara:strand:- start:2 stop:193 length:192 start_codon:yes stop_codon:yes gene_type:complete